MHDRKSLNFLQRLLVEIPTLKALLVRAQKEVKKHARKSQIVLENTSIIINTFLVQI